ncbi:NB-ARC domain-containing protein [Agromyces kandeliae]|uniref:NB-ARC domain-containing protein n=1 Tax=Agromyces kandeliae TaxID=2666141 RepID=A0A6L5QY97_9MICO|nr:NB-ARC domain-containing protein [Agromyces kandeliae]MRX42128.1 hypothetical protein [Agromyces kandeliae]
MAEITSKARAFIVIDSLEQDLRYSIDNYLLDHLNEEEVLGPDLPDAQERRSRDDAGPTLSITNYLYLRQAYDVLLRHSHSLPRDLGDELARNVGALDAFVGVRNRVMHGRPLRVDDLDNATAFVNRFSTRHFALTRDVLARLDTDADWEPAYTTTPAPHDRVLHNLPAADFDETGLVGRTSEVSQLVDLLVKGRDRMITVTGEGGIGKTALALEASYSLVDALDPPFEAVLWVSLKHERLTADGVRSIADAVRDVSGATNQLGRALEPSFGGSVDELADYLSGLSALVVIDNLESVQGTEVLRLYDELPESVTFLFTSRVGIGQIERRMPLGGLKESDAVLLFRKFSRRRGQAGLAGLSQEAAERTVRRLRHSPLAIRWFILSVESGKVPTDTLRNQDELLKFCVDNVYEALTPDSKLVLAVLRTLDRPISFDELAVVTALEVDTLRRTAQDLAQGSLLVRTPSSELGAPDLLELSPTARAYLPRVDLSNAVLQAVIDREAAYLQDREEARLAQVRRELDPNVVHARSPEDEPTAHLLRLALRLSTREDFDAATLHISRARSLNPEYYEIDRVDAFIASRRGNVPGATSRYRAALSACESDVERARVSHFLAGHLARNGHDMDAAIPHAEFAHKILANADTAMALGNYYVWIRRFAEGQELLEQALDSDSKKLQRIVTTALVDSWRRWAEDELQDRMPDAAVDKCLAGFTAGRSLLDAGSHDFKLIEAVGRSVTDAAKALRYVAEATPQQIRRLKSALDYILDNVGRFRVVESWKRLTAAVASLPDSIQKQLLPNGWPSPAIRQAGSEQLPVSPGIQYSGSIITVKETYGFIAHPEFPNNVFFHFGTLRNNPDPALLIPGTLVSFTHARDQDGRDRAETVHIEA